MMLSGFIEVTVKSKKPETNETEIIKVTAEFPKYDIYALEQEVHGLKQTLEINPKQDFEHLDQRL